MEVRPVYPDAGLSQACRQAVLILQGYLAHMEPRPPLLGLMQTHYARPSVESKGGAPLYERGTPVDMRRG